MLKLSVPHNWQPELLKTLDLSCVGEFYGKLEADVIGGGRASNISVPVSRRALAEEIRRIHSRGMKFNYLFNATCLDNRELTRHMQVELDRLVDWLIEIGADGVTVTLPYLLDYVRRRAPQFAVTVSTMAHVDSPEKARFWEGIGADRITLDEVMVNRDFRRIAAIRSAVRCKLQLIVNNGCLHECPFTIVHSAAQSHASQSKHCTGGFLLDFYRIYCIYMRLREPARFIRADWIRPEDLFLYENLGIDNFKLVNRSMATRYLSRIVSAYTARRYEGNLLDLLPSPEKSLVFSGPNGIFRRLRYFLRPVKVNVFKLIRMREILGELEAAVSIDNRCLDGFIERLADHGCAEDLCGACRICGETAEKALRGDPKRIKRIVGEMETLIDSFVSGELFNYR